MYASLVTCLVMLSLNNLSITCNLFDDAFVEQFMHHLSLVTCLGMLTLTNLCVTCHLFSDNYFDKFMRNLSLVWRCFLWTILCVTCQLFVDIFSKQYSTLPVTCLVMLSLNIFCTLKKAWQNNVVKYQCRQAYFLKQCRI